MFLASNICLSSGEKRVKGKARSRVFTDFGRVSANQVYEDDTVFTHVLFPKINYKKKATVG